jgi:hypothetical protein
MPEKIGNFILELVPAPGVGSFVLGTPVTGRLPWSAGVTAGYWASGGQVFYIANDTTKQEWGYGTYTTGGLTRDVVLWTSAGSTAKLNFATNPVYVYPEVPAERMVYRDPSTGRLIAAYDISSAQQNLGPLAGHRNRLVNSALMINQRAYVSNTAALAGVYMHDRWKAGVGGCTYTFAAGITSTQINITAGTLQQVIEAGMIEGGTYVLSWTGNATARIDTSAYNTSPLVVTGLAAATAHTVEFNTGTVLRPQFETGDTPSQFEYRHGEQLLCDRYCVSGNFDINGYCLAGQFVTSLLSLPVKMRGSPTITLNATTTTNLTTPTLVALNNRELRLGATGVAAGGFTLGGSYVVASEL